MQYSKKLNISRLFTLYLFLSLACLLTVTACRTRNRTGNVGTEEGHKQENNSSKEKKDSFIKSKLNSDDGLSPQKNQNVVVAENPESPIRLEIDNVDNNRENYWKGRSNVYTITITNAERDRIDLSNYRMKVKVAEGTIEHFDRKNKKHSFKLAYLSDNGYKTVKEPSLEIYCNEFFRGDYKVRGTESRTARVTVMESGTLHKAEIEFVLEKVERGKPAVEEFRTNRNWERVATSDIFFDKNVKDQKRDDLEFVKLKEDVDPTKVTVGKDGKRYDLEFFVLIRNKSTKYLCLKNINIKSKLWRYEEDLSYGHTEYFHDKYLLPGESTIATVYSKTGENGVLRESLEKKKRIWAPSTWTKKYDYAMRWQVYKGDIEVYEGGSKMLKNMLSKAREDEKDLKKAEAQDKALKIKPEKNMPDYEIKDLDFILEENEDIDYAGEKVRRQTEG